MKHVKLEYDEPTYEVIREAAYRARLPIKQFCKQAASAAARATSVPVPCTRTPPQAAGPAEGGTANGTQTDAEESRS